MVQQRDELTAPGVVARMAACAGDAAAEQQCAIGVEEQRLAGRRGAETTGLAPAVVARRSRREAEAIRQESVCSQPFAKPTGFRNST